MVIPPSILKCFLLFLKLIFELLMKIFLISGYLSLLASLLCFVIKC